MAKRSGSPYRIGRRSHDWIKLKHHRTQEVVIAGWKPGQGRRADAVGSLVLGIPDDGELRYAGRVGTGFSEKELVRLLEKFGPLERDTPAIDDVPPTDAKGVRWLEPSLVGEVEYAEVTPDGRLRQPSWRGWRPDKSPADVVRET